MIKAFRAIACNLSSSSCEVMSEISVPCLMQPGNLNGDAAMSVAAECIAASGQTPVLSKSARKRLEKEQRWKATAPERKQRRKEKAARRKELIKKQKEEGTYSPKFKRPLREDIVQSGVTVVVDAGFEDKMSVTDNKSFFKQLSYCYSANRRSVRPVNFCVTSWSATSADLFKKSTTGYVNWQARFLEEPYDAVFAKDKLVYLSAESDNVLESLQDDKVYVIGGLVDHNHYKGLCHRLAVEKGIAHARLPISEYLSMATRQVLTVNHVFEVLGQFILHNDWQKAFFEVLPKRKDFAARDASKSHAATEAGNPAADGTLAECQQDVSCNADDAPVAENSGNDPLDSSTSLS